MLGCRYCILVQLRAQLLAGCWLFVGDIQRYWGTFYNNDCSDSCFRVAVLSWVCTSNEIHENDENDKKIYEFDFVQCKFYGLKLLKTWNCWKLEIVENISIEMQLGVLWSELCLSNYIIVIAIRQIIVCPRIMSSLQNSADLQNLAM